ncbi:hypothetical protein HanPI659440_Chr14g0529971 [Helianthus annuus]|nr:hypothetical protein HanPI659440_Chr14g0529971 [Helianthus annuus]
MLILFHTTVLIYAYCFGVMVWLLGFVCPNQLEIRTDGGPRKIDRDKVG